MRGDHNPADSLSKMRNNGALNMILNRDAEQTFVSEWIVQKPLQHIDNDTIENEFKR